MDTMVPKEILRAMSKFILNNCYEYHFLRFYS